MSKYLYNSESNEITINAPIDDWWGYNLSTVQNDLNMAGGADLNIKLHSPGGSVIEGLAVYAAFKNYPGNVTVTNVGLAASISSVIALAGKAYMYPTSFFMVHNPYGGAFGESKEMRKTADLMDKMTTTIAHVYAEKMVSTKGYDYPEALALALQWMEAETWFTAEEALAAGLIDGIVNGNDQYSIDDFAVLAQYGNTPNYIYNSILDKNKNMSKSIIDKIRGLLASSEEAPEQEVIETVAPDLDAARAALEAAGFTVQEVATTEAAPDTIVEPEKEEDSEVLQLVQAMAAEISALKAQVKNTAGAPSGGYANAVKKSATGNDKAFAPLVALFKR